MKTVYLWVVDYGWNVWGADPPPNAKPTRKIDASLFFSSIEKFKELYTGDDSDQQQQLVTILVPDDFNHLDFIPDNY